MVDWPLKKETKSYKIEQDHLWFMDLFNASSLFSLLDLRL